MSDPSLSSTPGPHVPKPETMQHIHHHSLFHPRLQPQGGGQPLSGAAASYQYQPGAHGWYPDGHYYRRWRGPSRLVWVSISLLSFEILSGSRLIRATKPGISPHHPTVPSRSRYDRLVLLPPIYRIPRLGLGVQTRLGMQDRTSSRYAR